MNSIDSEALVLGKLIYISHSYHQRKCGNKCKKAFRRDFSAADGHIPVNKRDTADDKSHKEHIRCHREVIKQPRYHKRKAEYTDNGADSEKDDESDVLFDSRQFQRQHVYHLVIHAENHHHSSAAYTRYNICHAEYDTVNDIQ